jgi:CRISPR system Cascade subunit CasE
MIRTEVALREFRRWMGIRRLQDADHTMHCLLTESFGELAPRPFRLIMPHGQVRGVLYGYARADGQTLCNASGTYACPSQLSILPTGRIASKPMPIVWRTGKRLGFETRIRPIVRRSRNADCRPGKECDTFALEASRHPEGEMPYNREAVYTDWLSNQLDRRGGARLDHDRTKLVSCRRTRAVRKLHARHSEGPDAVMRGVLTITDPDAFSNLLAHGIGRHRAYGYDMLLLRPA